MIILISITVGLVAGMVTSLMLFLLIYCVNNSYKNISPLVRRWKDNASRSKRRQGR